MTDSPSRSKTLSLKAYNLFFSRFPDGWIFRIYQFQAFFLQSSKSLFILSVHVLLFLPRCCCSGLSLAIFKVLSKSNMKYKNRRSLVQRHQIVSTVRLDKQQSILVPFWMCCGTLNLAKFDWSNLATEPRWSTSSLLPGMIIPNYYYHHHHHHHHHHYYYYYSSFTVVNLPSPTHLIKPKFSCLLPNDITSSSSIHTFLFCHGNSYCQLCCNFFTWDAPYHILKPIIQLSLF